MERVEEIKAAITAIPIEEFRRLAVWLQEQDQLLWDQQMDHDSCAGELDFLFEEADTDCSKLSRQRYSSC